jgi:hypothetical protein
VQAVPNLRSKEFKGFREVFPFVMLFVVLIGFSWIFKRPAWLAAKEPLWRGSETGSENHSSTASFRHC